MKATSGLLNTGSQTISLDLLIFRYRGIFVNIWPLKTGPIMKGVGREGQKWHEGTDINNVDCFWIF